MTWEGPDRRSRTALSVALADVRELKGSVESLATAVAETSTTADVRQSARRVNVQNSLAALLVVATVMVLGALSLFNQNRVKALAKANLESITFLQACLVPGNPCAESLQQQFEINRNQMQAGVGCVLLIRPEALTQADVDRCFAEAQARFPRPPPPPSSGLP